MSGFAGKDTMMTPSKKASTSISKQKAKLKAEIARLEQEIADFDGRSS